MKAVLEEYGVFIVTFMIGAVLFMVLFGLVGRGSGATMFSVENFFPEPQSAHVDAGDNSAYINNKPRLEAHDVYIDIGGVVDLKDERIISVAEDCQGNDMRNHVEVLRIYDERNDKIVSQVSSGYAGTYEITYRLVDATRGYKVSTKAKIIVE